METERDIVKAERNENRVLIIIATLFAIGFSFYVLKELKSILIPFFIAIVITFVFEPMRKWMSKKKLPNWLAITLILITILIISNIVSVFVYTSINSFSDQFPKYEKMVGDMVHNVARELKIPDRDIKNFNESLKISNLLKDGSITGTVTGILTGFLGVFADYILILVYVVFLLSELSSIKARVLKAFSADKAAKITATLSDIFVDVRTYISGKTLINLVQGIIFTIILWAFGIDFAVVWGFLCFLSHYLPNIGSFVSTVLPGIMAFLQYDNIITPIIIILILVVVQNVIGNIIEPQVLGDRLDLSPILILLALLFWGYVWGVVGMILSVPIMSMIKITLSKFETTKPLAILMSYSSVSLEDERKAENKLQRIIRQRGERIFRRRHKKNMGNEGTNLTPEKAHKKVKE